MYSIRKPTILILTLLFLSTSMKAESCNKGCLVCGSDAKCKICDLTNYFKLDDGNCSRVTGIDNCLQIDSTGKCIVCESDYYVDLSTHKCVEVNILFKIEHCTSYSSAQSCLTCRPGFYIQNSICIGAETSLNNCEVQLDEKTCSECKNGFIMLPDGSGCTQVPATASNCANFTYVSCKSCILDYMLDKNRYIRDLQKKLKLNADPEAIALTLHSTKENNVNRGFTSVCHPLELSNCIEYEAVNKCKKCELGYFLNEESLCESNPPSIIPNCEVYISESKCRLCLDGYFLNTPSTCIAVEEITNCRNYDKGADRSLCTKCEEEYFLSEDSKCQERERADIENCATFRVAADRCQTCLEGYTITNDGNKCLPSVDNCQQYKFSSLQSTEHACSACKEGYYLESSTECKEGSVDFCKKYELEFNDCVECLNGYYLESTVVCKPHEKIPACERYHSSEKDRCISCDNKNLGFEVANRCAIASKIPGCVEYSTATTCKTCGEGYILSATTCTEIPAEMNCLQADSELNCTHCKPNYILHDGTCKTIPGYILHECETSNINDGLQTLSSGRCTGCKQTAIAWNFANEFICLENSWVADLGLEMIDHCAQLNITGDDAVCNRCEEGYYLDNNVCESSCDTSSIIISGLSTSGDNYRIEKGQHCKSGSFSGQINNCEVYAYANNVTNGDIDALPVCVRCKTNYGKVIDYTSPNSTGLEDASILENIKWKFIAPVAFFPKVVSCAFTASQSTITMLLAQEGEKHIDGCEYYQRIGVTNTYGCVRCKTGKRGIISDTEDGDFISSCATTSCNSTFVPGLQAQLNGLISCYTCTSSTSIPFLFFKGGSTYTDINGYRKYKLNQNGVELDPATPEGFNVNCNARNGGDFTHITSFNLPSNCAIGGFNVEATDNSAENANQTNLSTTANLAVICLACEPGYKRSFATKTNDVEIPYMVYQCNQIQNCKSKQWFNYCTECTRDHVFLYDDNTGVDYTQCVSYSKDPNCLATYEAVTGECAICKKGYIPNHDGLCEALRVPDCIDDDYDHGRSFSRVAFGTIFYQMPRGRGCHQCRQGFTSVYSNLNANICVTSSYLSILDDVTDTEYIRNCNRYYIESNKLLCARCTSGHVLSENNEECFANTQLSNCVLAASSTECITCASEYVVVDHKCTRMNIDNCEIYDQNPNNTEQSCFRCVEGYYRSDRNCVKGQIANCIRYKTNGNGCNECKEGYIVVRSTNGDYCFRAPNDLNCHQFNASKFQQNVLECNRCDPNNALHLSTSMGNESTFKCIPLNEIDGCEEYENQMTISSSGLLCKQCQAPYYLSNKTCKLRLNRDNNCAEQTKDKDECSECKQNFFLKAGACIPNPQGVGNCSHYADRTTCVKCDSGYYLSDNACLGVPSENVISNCIDYDNADTCARCRQNYALVNNTCVETKAENCLTVKNATECETCDPSRGLRTEDGITSCVRNSDNRCISFIQNFPFVCEKCSSGFYPGSEGICTAVSTDIDNCETYDSANTCLKCQKGFALNSNRDNCTNSSEYRQYIGSTCDDSVIEDNPICVQCASGYIFDEAGVCTKSCETGCLYCDPDNPSECLICAPGSYMGESGSCILESGVDGSDSSTPLNNVFAAFILFMLAILSFT